MDHSVIVRRRRLCQFLVALALIFQPVLSRAQTDQYLSDMPRLYPRVYANWTKSLPYAVKMPDWITKFVGTSGPVHDLTISSARYKFGTVCVPHDCGGNIMGVLFTPAQGRVVAVATLSTQLDPQAALVIGQPTTAEFACINRATNDSGITAC